MRRGRNVAYVKEKGVVFNDCRLLRHACLFFCVMRESSEKRGLHPDKVKLNKRNAELNACNVLAPYCDITCGLSGSTIFFDII
jgi:hypothetical protein